MSALLRIGRALARTGRHLLYADRAACCCSPCPAFYKALPCNNPGSCAPVLCQVYVCTDNPCTQPGMVFQYLGWCYKVQPGVIDPEDIPPGSATLTRDAFGALGPAFCLQTGAQCNHPGCQCIEGPFLYFAACPCPGGAGDGLCRVISLDDYAIVAGSIGSACVVAAFGEGGCQWVGPSSPRAPVLPPGCIRILPAGLLGAVTDTCCDCCPGCAHSRITGDACQVIRAINPGWACTPTSCCCQRIRFEWSLFAHFIPEDPGFQPTTVTNSGSYSLDLMEFPFGLSVPTTLEITQGGSSWTETVNIGLLCGAQNIVPPGIGTFYYGEWQPRAPGTFGDFTTQQSGTYGCAAYSANWLRTKRPGPFGTEIATFIWSITATASAGTAIPCSRGCSGSHVVPADPCENRVGDIGDGEPVGTGAFL
mgnify:FL=1